MRSGSDDVTGVNAQGVRGVSTVWLAGVFFAQRQGKSIAKSCVLWRVNGSALKKPEQM